MALIGTIAVNVVAKTNAFVKGMADARKGLRSFETQAEKTAAMVGSLKKAIGTGLAIFGTAKVIGSLRATAEEMDALGKAADQLGIKTEKLAALRLGGELQGVEIADLEKGLRNLAKAAAEVVATGNKTKGGIFAQLKLSADELRLLSPDEMLKRVADGLQGVTNQADKLRIVTELFGRSGQPMLSLLEDGSAGLRAFEKEAEALGLAIDREGIKKVEAFNDALTRLQKAFGGAKMLMIIDIAPVAQKAVENLTEIVKGLRLQQAATQKPKGKRTPDRWLTGDLEFWTNWFTERRVKADIKAGIETKSAGINPITQFGVRGVPLALASRPGFDPRRIDQAFGNVNQAINARSDMQARAKALSYFTDKGFRGLSAAIKAATEKGPELAKQVVEAQQKLKTIGLKSYAQWLFKPPPEAIADFRKAQQKEEDRFGALDMLVGDNAALEKGTAAAFTAEKQGNRLNQLMREQIALAKRQVEKLGEIANNTKGNGQDVWQFAAG